MGEEIGLVMPHGEVLRGGDRVLASDGRVFEVVSAPERLLHIEAPALARAFADASNGKILTKG